MFFELWILLGGNSCSVSKTQSLDLWRGQSFIGSGHFFSPTHIVKVQYAFFFNSSYFNTWRLPSSPTTFWPQKQTNKQLLMRLELPLPQSVNIRTGTGFGTQTDFISQTHPLLCLGDDSCPKSHSLNKISMDNSSINLIQGTRNHSVHRTNPERLLNRQDKKDS